MNQGMRKSIIPKYFRSNPFLRLWLSFGYSIVLVFTLFLSSARIHSIPWFGGTLKSFWPIIIRLGHFTASTLEIGDDSNADFISSIDKGFPKSNAWSGIPGLFRPRFFDPSIDQSGLCIPCLDNDQMLHNMTILECRSVGSTWLNWLLDFPNKQLWIHLVLLLLNVRSANHHGKIQRQNFHHTIS